MQQVRSFFFFRFPPHAGVHDLFSLWSVKAPVLHLCPPLPTPPPADSSHEIVPNSRSSQQARSRLNIHLCERTLANLSRRLSAWGHVQECGTCVCAPEHTRTPFHTSVRGSIFRLSPCQPSALLQHSAGTTGTLEFLLSGAQM